MQTQRLTPQASDVMRPILPRQPAGPANHSANHPARCHLPGMQCELANTTPLLDTGVCDPTKPPPATSTWHTQTTNVLWCVRSDSYCQGPQGSQQKLCHS